MLARISILGSDILCECDGSADIRIPLTEQTLTKIKDWKEQYKRSVRSNNPEPLLSIGIEIFDWLDESGWASQWFRGTGDRVLEIAVEEAESEISNALLDLPWEILAHKGDFLISDPSQLFEVFRSIKREKNAQPQEPAHRDIALMFMAASPRGQQELDYEAEEAAILDATERLLVQVVVEESGCAEFLKDRLAQEGPFEAVHISCHGTILENGDPVLALETPEGNLDPITPGDFAGVLGEGKAPLVFLSACLTAASSAEDSDEITAPFVRELIRSGVPNVLGWDGSVSDLDAIYFAQGFYCELAEYASIPFAAASARRNLLRMHRDDLNKGRHWHLARVYSGPNGAGKCCDRSKDKRHLRKGAGFKEFLDKANSRVRVASAQEFVGRRRQAQDVLSAFRGNNKAGVLIFGMGNLGKSSLAARIANRVPKLHAVIVFERYDALAIFEQLVAALPPRERSTCENNWRDQIADDGAILSDALEEMLIGSFDEHPILLIIDDLEQILEKPQPDQIITPVKDAPGTPDTFRKSLGAVLSAFKATETESRLLLTSRYDFTLPDGRGGDLADTLERIQLPPMRDKERSKQWRAAERVAGRLEEGRDEEESSVAERALNLAGGNPGLQEILCRPILAGELDAARIALDAVEEWKATGEIPTEENQALEFFKRIVFETYRNALSEDQRRQLRAATLFSEGLPVPVTALEEAGRALGIDEPHRCLQRLMGLGLVDDWGEIDGVEYAAANPLARPLSGEQLSNEEQKILATAVIPSLVEAWQDEEGCFPEDFQGVEAAKLGLISDAPADILESAVYAAGIFLFRRLHNARAALNSFLLPALAKIKEQRTLPKPEFLLLGANCAERIGEAKTQIDLLEMGLSLRSDDKKIMSIIAAAHAEAKIALDGPDKALQALRKTANLLSKDGDERLWAITKGKIADILEMKGKIDEALHIHKEELLVFERIGDKRERAVTMVKITDILSRRGESDNALRVLREEVLPVFKSLGERRLCAITNSRIAGILTLKGITGKALNILRKEVLTVHEALGDISERAATMGQIADILEIKGEIKEALRIRREEELPVYKRLGDLHSWAKTMGKIANILEQQGEIDEALRIRFEEELPIYERMDDVSSRALTKGQIARILAHQGKIEEALRIRREEELPVYKRLGEEREWAMSMVEIADILAVQGKTDEALSILINDCLPLLEKNHDKNNIARVRFICAKIRLNRKEIVKEEAQIIHDELNESFILNKEIRNISGVAYSGMLHGQYLARGGYVEESLYVLDESAGAFEKLGLADKVAGVRSLQEKIRKKEV